MTWSNSFHSEEEYIKLLKTLTKFLYLTAALVILSGATHESPDETLTTTKTAGAGKVRAELSYQTETLPEPLRELRLYHPRLKLMREDSTVLDEPLPGEGKEGTVRHIDGPEVRLPAGGGEPEILLRIRADYKHAAAILIYRYNAATDHYDLRQQQRPIMRSKVLWEEVDSHGT